MVGALRGPATLAGAAALFTLAVQLFYQARFGLGVVDDGYIHLRIAHNLASGEGPVFNLGERVEVSSSPLWTLLLAAGLALGIPDLALAKGLGLLLAAACGAVTALVGRRVAGPREGLAAAVMLAIAPGFAAWSSSGMETPLALLGLTLVTWSALTVRSLGGVVRTCVGAGFLAWVRPEALVLIASVLAVAAYRLPDRRLRAVIVGGLAFAAPLALLFLSRRWYFGEWLPNTYYAKVAGGGLDQRLRGIHYVGKFITLHVVFCALALVALFRRELVVRSVGLIVLNVVAAVLWAGDDGFQFARLMLPALPLVCVMAAGALPLVREARRVLAVGGALAVQLVWSLWGNDEFKRFHTSVIYARNCATIGEVLKAMPPGTVAAVGIGALAHVSERRILDLVGLADKHIARARRLPGARVGHDRSDTAYVLGRAPEIVLAFGWMTERPLTDESELEEMRKFLESWASGHALVTHPRFRASYVARVFKVGGQYLRLWFRRDVAPAAGWVPLPAPG